MKKIYLALFQLFLFLPVIVLAQTPFPTPGKVFESNLLPNIYIEIDPADLDEILDPANIFSEEHYPATFIFETDTDLDTLENIGFRLRGNTSQSAQKKSFKISFNTFEAGRKYKGLEKMNINGEHNDPSVVRSNLCWTLCRDMGIPASRSNHVKLYINGEYWGLYINVEHIDEEFCQLRFGPELGNLYKCLWPATLEYLGSNPNAYKLESGGRRIYDLKTNTAEDDYSDLAHFIDVLNNTPDSELPCELEKVFDVQNYLRVIAMDVLTANWDGPIYNKNNFYLYSNPQTGKVHYIPYDLDNTFGIQWFGEWTERNIYTWAQSGEPRPIYNKIIANDHYRAQFTFYVEQLLENYFNDDYLFSLMDDRKSLIESAIPDDPFYPQDYGFTTQDFNNSYTQGLSVFHVPIGLKPFVSARASSAIDQLQNTNAAPIIYNTEQAIGDATQDIFVRASVDDETNVDVKVEYTFNGLAGEVSMFDSGNHNDGAAGDGVYGATISAFNEPGLLEYYIRATDSDAKENRYPYCESFEVSIEENVVPLYINEFMARNNNASGISDEAGESDDWLELYNAGTTPIDLSNYFLSDDLQELPKWNLPDEDLPAGAYLVIWADDDVNQGVFHASFKLSADGEEIVLSNNSGDLVDYVSFASQNENQATGRLPNGTGIMQPVQPTPGASNQQLVAIQEVMDLPDFMIVPNPFDAAFQVRSETIIKEIQLSDFLGRIVFSGRYNSNSVVLRNTVQIPGVYVLTIKFANGQVGVKKLLKIE